MNETPWTIRINSGRLALVDYCDLSPAAIAEIETQHDAGNALILLTPTDGTLTAAVQGQSTLTIDPPRDTTPGEYWDEF